MANIVRVSFDTATGIISTSPVSITTLSDFNYSNASSSSTSNRLDKLNDVVATNEVDGGVPVYDAATDKYIIKQLTAVTPSDIDGGGF